jgi:hypothetical protein
MNNMVVLGLIVTQLMVGCFADLTMTKGGNGELGDGERVRKGEGEKVRKGKV